MSVTMQLAPGAFLGQTLASRGFAGFSVSETSYAPSARFPRHDHELASICIVQEGCYEESYGRQTHEFSRGDVIVHPAGDHHANVHAPAEVRLTIVEFSNEYLDALRSRVDVLRERSSAPAGHLLTELGTRIAREAAIADATSDLACEGIVLEMVAAIARTPAPGVVGRLPWLDRVEAALRDGGASWSLGDLASLADVHPSYLARAFRRRYGCSIGDFRRRMMVDKAKHRILGTSDPLCDIALDCGFNDQSHMTRCFGVELGVTPGRYRSGLRLGERT